MRWSYSAGSLATQFLLTLGVSSVFAQAHPPYRMLDSGFPAEDAFPVVWVDGHRVLFTGVELGKHAEKPNQRYYYRGLKNAAFLWDTRENKVTKFKDVTVGSFCSTGTYVSYGILEPQGDKEVVVVYAGKFGEETKLGVRSDLPSFNPISCRYHAKSWLPPEAKGRRVALLLEEHGYVDFGPDLPAKLTPEERNAPPILRSLDGKKAIPLNIEGRYLMNRRLRFSYLRFSNEYFSRADTINHDELAPAFYATPEGKVRKVEFGVRRQLGGTYHAVRLGIFLNTDGDTLDGRHGGGYLLSSGKLTQIVSGGLRSASVSPNGCNVAFVYAASKNAISQGYHDWKEGKPGNTIRMIDVCEGDKK